MPVLENESEHRWGERVRVNIPVRVEIDHLTRANARVQNLSLSGALMTSESDFCLNTLIEVSIALPPPSNRTAVMKAIVARKCSGGVGIEWNDFAPNIVRDLLQLALRSPR